VADDAAFRTFVDRHGPTLLQAARLLTGDHHRGEDLVQVALTKLYLKWDKLTDPLAYARRILVTSHIDSTRRRWWGERPSDDLPDESHSDAAFAATEERDEIRRLLRELRPRERAAIVLRYYCDLSEEETAATLGVAVGTVKSTCARALARLRVESGVT
jgi:RNA polymerase sigma-70 factor (sigma-E family)